MSCTPARTLVMSRTLTPDNGNVGDSAVVEHLNPLAFSLRLECRNKFVKGLETFMVSVETIAREHLMLVRY